LIGDAFLAAAGVFFALFAGVAFATEKEKRQFSAVNPNKNNFTT
jgi:hypothetical protein